MAAFEVVAALAALVLVPEVVARLDREFGTVEPKPVVVAVVATTGDVTLEVPLTVLVPVPVPVPVVEVVTPVLAALGPILKVPVVE